MFYLLIEIIANFIDFIIINSFFVDTLQVLNLLITP